MRKQIITKNGASIVVLHSDEVLIADGQSALDLIASAFYNDNCEHMLLNKAAIAEEFFTLSSGMAGEVLQKFINYGMRLAIVGNFGGYTSKALKDFIYESNRGNNIFFAATEQEGVDKLGS